MEATDGSEPITFENIAPAGTNPEEIALFDSALGGGEANLAASPFSVCPSLSVCKYPEGPFAGFFPPLSPQQKFVVAVLVKVPPAFEGTLEDTFKVSGGGAPSGEISASNTASADPPFGKLGFKSSLSDQAGNPYTQAGGHPYKFTTEFNFATYSYAKYSGYPTAFGIPGWVGSGTEPLHDPKEIITDLPPGLLANPQGVPHCTLADYFAQECSLKSQVGVLGLRLFGYTEGDLHALEPVYNLQPSPAYPGQLGATIASLPIILINAGVRSASDYGVTATNVASEAGLSRVRLTLWGVPADPSHDNQRRGECATVHSEFISAEAFERKCEAESGGGNPAEVEPTPFLTMPTECSGNQLPIASRYNSWQVQDEYGEASTSFPAVDGCNALSFNPSIEARPTTNLADASSGLEFKLHVPQNEDPEGVATPALKEAVVKLPAGLTINPSSAGGLTGCSEAEIGLHVEAPAACPDASKLGTAEVHTPLLLEPLKGFLYLATPHSNPEHSLLAGYISLEGSGVRVKLPGRFESDPQSGQITARFSENPQVPFEDLQLNIFGGARGSLRTPAVCGTYETTSSLTPFSAPESGPPATPTTTFTTKAAAHEGESCATATGAEPSAPLLRAGTETPRAGIYSPFSLKLVREDGSQEVTGVETALPPGLVGRLAGIPYCPDSAIAAASTKSGAEEKASPSCPASSEIGTIDVGAGAGPTPIHVPGHVYLAGPYKGAPVSVEIITPAVAGPFDLGTVAVRAALYVNPETAQITARSDEIPHILEGIPLDIRSVTLKLNRSQFTLNPTSCEEMHFAGTATSLLGVASPLSQRFQLGGCSALAFKPKLALRLEGGLKRRGHPALTSVLTMPPGGANIASAVVALPPTEILDNAHIKSPCTRVQFAAGSCPPGSVLGSARAITPLLDQPLEGPVYLMTGFGHKLPDLVADLNGQIHVILDGKVDSTKAGGLRTTFAAVPDAPVTKFVLKLAGAKKGLLQNRVSLCANPQSATALFTGQNGESVELTPKLAVLCRKGGKRHGKHHHRAGRRRAG